MATSRIDIPGMGQYVCQFDWNYGSHEVAPLQPVVQLQVVVGVTQIQRRLGVIPMDPKNPTHWKLPRLISRTRWDDVVEVGKPNPGGSPAYRSLQILGVPLAEGQEFAALYIQDEGHIRPGIPEGLTEEEAKTRIAGVILPHLQGMGEQGMGPVSTWFIDLDLGRV